MIIFWITLKNLLQLHYKIDIIDMMVMKIQKQNILNYIPENTNNKNAKMDMFL